MEDVTVTWRGSCKMMSYQSVPLQLLYLRSDITHRLRAGSRYAESVPTRIRMQTAHIPAFSPGDTSPLSPLFSTTSQSYEPGCRVVQPAWLSKLVATHCRLVRCGIEGGHCGYFWPLRKRTGLVGPACALRPGILDHSFAIHRYAFVALLRGTGGIDKNSSSWSLSRCWRHG